MWNTKNDVSGWNLNRDASRVKTNCNWCKDGKCYMSTLLPCDYRKDDKCTQCKG